MASKEVISSSIMSRSALQGYWNYAIMIANKTAEPQSQWTRKSCQSNKIRQLKKKRHRRAKT
jgi:hypothetical protein